MTTASQKRSGRVSCVRPSEPGREIRGTGREFTRGSRDHPAIATWDAVSRFEDAQLFNCLTEFAATIHRGVSALQELSTKRRGGYPAFFFRWTAGAAGRGELPGRGDILSRSVNPLMESRAAAVQVTP